MGCCLKVFGPAFSFKLEWSNNSHILFPLRTCYAHTGAYISRTAERTTISRVQNPSYRWVQLLCYLFEYRFPLWKCKFPWVWNKFHIPTGKCVPPCYEAIFHFPREMEIFHSPRGQDIFHFPRVMENYYISGERLFWQTRQLNQRPIQYFFCYKTGREGI